MDGIIKAEWNKLKKVVIHRPGMEMFFGLLDPTGSLYERAFSMYGALREHEMMEDVLRHEFNIDVIRLKETVVKVANWRPDVRKKLIELAREVVSHEGDENSVEEIQREFDRNAKYLDTEHFFDILVMNPGIDFRLKGGLRNIRMNIEGRQPLSNLYFMRDQQFVTDNGLVLTRMASSTRRDETKVTKFLWEEVLGIPILHEMEDPATIEGGEFVPMGDFALVGIGSRTNQEAIDQLLSLQLNYKEVGVVHQPMHPLINADEPDPMVNMHLDTYFNVPASNVVIGSDLLLKNARVQIYHNEGGGRFKKDDKEHNLWDYISSKGFHVVPITTLEQLSYASNFLCIEDTKIMAIEVERIVDDVITNLTNKERENPERYGKLLEQVKKDYELLKNEGQFFPHKKEMYQAGIDSYPIILKNLTGGYGGAHCMTCSLTRE